MKNKSYMRDISYQNIVFGTIIDRSFRRTLYRYPFDKYFIEHGFQLAFPTIILLELTEYKINEIEVWDNRLKQMYLTTVDIILSDGTITTWNGQAFRVIPVRKCGIVKKRGFTT
jgi:hypothetical protein